MGGTGCKCLWLICEEIQEEGKFGGNGHPIPDNQEIKRRNVHMGGASIQLNRARRAVVKVQGRDSPLRGNFSTISRETPKIRSVRGHRDQPQGDSADEELSKSRLYVGKN